MFLYCTRPRLTSEVEARIISLLAGPLDWDYLMRAAARLGVLPLLCRNMRAFSEDIPDEVLNNLQKQYRNISVWNLLLTSELLAILSLFEAHGIAAVPFKGPTLAALAYGDISLRQFADLDLFLRQEDMPTAKELLLSKGYRPELSLSPAREAAYLESQYHYVLIREDGRFLVELHWEFTPRYLHFPLASQGLWDRLVRLNLRGTEVLSFSPEELLLILCVHGARHSWERLGWICDLVYLIESHPGLKWGWILDRASALHCERMVYLGLFLAKDLLGATLPSDLWQTLQSDRAVQKLAREVRRFFLQEGEKTALGIYKEFLFQVKMRERLGEKFKYCFYLAFTPNTIDWQLVSLPPSLSFLYYLFRPLRLVLKNRLRMKSIP